MRPLPESLKFPLTLTLPLNVAEFPFVKSPPTETPPVKVAEELFINFPVIWTVPAKFAELSFFKSPAIETDTLASKFDKPPSFTKLFPKMTVPLSDGARVPLFSILISKV